MNIKHSYFIALTAVLLVLPSKALAGAGRSSGVTVPKGTTVQIQYQDGSETPELKPAEQVAVIFLIDIEDVEKHCVNRDNGFGRLCSLDELVKNVTAPSGGVLGLTQDPGKDPNYHYSISIVGDNCLIEAIPQTAGLGGFAWWGTIEPGAIFAKGNFYFEAGDANMAQAKKLGMVGHTGRGFSL